MSTWACLAMMALAGQKVWAYPRYRNPDTGAGYCAECHGAFSAGASPKGTVFPSDSKHEMHRSASFMNTACALCHLATDHWNPHVGASAGTTNNPGLGCSGCHTQAGLVARHALNSVTDCLECHSLTAAPPESTKPRYYGTPDTRADHACNAAPMAMTNENWSLGDFAGLDNDGNGLYDLADAACGGSGLRVSPETGLEASGDVGGPFAPAAIDYDVSNAGTSAFDWTVSRGQPWVSLSASHGSLGAGEGTNITVWLNTNTLSLPPGFYRDQVGFADAASVSPMITREITLTVLEFFTTNHPTPWWWLRSQGFTNDFEAAVLTVGANGLPLWQSFMAGLEPGNPASQLRVSGMPASGGESFVLTWNPVTGRVYTVWSSTNLGQNFGPLPGASNLPGTIRQWTNPITPSSPGRFYRLEVRKP